jgi:hypothetical protein
LLRVTKPLNALYSKIVGQIIPGAEPSKVKWLMSLSLSVRLTKPIRIAELLLAAHSNMRELLRIEELPKLWLQQLDKGTLIPPTTDIINKDDQGFMIELEGAEDAVMLVTYEIIEQLPYITAEEAGLRAAVSVGWMRSPIEYVIAASIAIALANACGTLVEDGATFWTDALEIAPKDFARHIVVRGTFDNVPAAAEALYASLEGVRNFRS